MSGYISIKHSNAKTDLIYGLRLHIKSLPRGSQLDIADKLGVFPNDMSKLLRLERSVSLSRLEEIGNAAGLELVMRWERKDGQQA